MDMDKSEVLTLALLAAKAAGTGGTGGTGAGGTGWTIRQIRMLESVLNAVAYTDKTAQDTADALIASLLASGGGENDPVTPDDPDTPDTPDTPDDPDTPDTPDTPDDPDTPDTPDDPGEADICTRAIGEASFTSSISTLTAALRPESGTAFAQEPDRVTIAYSGGQLPAGYRLYTVVLTRSGSTWTVASIRNANNASNLKAGGHANVTWGEGWSSITVSGMKAAPATGGDELTVSFGGSSSDPVSYSVTAEVM